MAAAPVAAAEKEAVTTGTRISGLMFADVTNLDLTNDGVDSPASGTGVDVKRFYIGITHTFDEVWSVHVTTDFNYVSNDNQTQLFIKKAYVQAKLSDALAGRLGSADMPWIPFVEGLYGYRYVEQTITDRLKFANSADWGLHAIGKLARDKLNYSVSVVNGAGYKNTTRSSSMDVEARIAFMPIKTLTLALGGYTGKLGKDVEGSATPALHTARRVNALVAWADDKLRVGAEYFYAEDWNQVTAVDSDTADGYSGWASYDFAPKWGVFTGVQVAKTSKDLNPDLEDRYFNVGVAHHPRENIDLALVYKDERVDGGGTVNTSNGVIGGLDEGTYREFGIWVRVAF